MNEPHYERTNPHGEGTDLHLSQYGSGIGQEFCRYWFQLKPGCIFLASGEGKRVFVGFMDIYSVVIFLCPLNIEDGMIWSRISMDMHMELDLSCQNPNKSRIQIQTNMKDDVPLWLIVDYHHFTWGGTGRGLLLVSPHNPTSEMIFLLSV
jgi:hypothetical protein